VLSAILCLLLSQVAADSAFSYISCSAICWQYIELCSGTVSLFKDVNKNKERHFPFLHQMN
jgi:hypothetical protein